MQAHLLLPKTVVSKPSSAGHIQSSREFYTNLHSLLELKLAPKMHFWVSQYGYTGLEGHTKLRTVVSTLQWDHCAKKNPYCFMLFLHIMKLISSGSHPSQPLTPNIRMQTLLGGDSGSSFPAHLPEEIGLQDMDC